MSDSADFWKLTSSGEDRGLSDWDRSVELEGPIRCPVDPGHQRGGKRVTDLSVVLPSLSVEDFVWTWNSECLVQDPVLKLLQAEGVSGFEVRRAAARFAHEPDIPAPELWELVVTGWGGVAPEKSGVKLDTTASCRSCGLLIYSNFSDPSQLIDRSQWDGSDIFIVWPLPKFIFVTDRVAQLIRKYKLTGVFLQRPDELQARSSTVSPGRLSYRMPYARARELGEHLGIA